MQEDEILNFTQAFSLAESGGVTFYFSKELLVQINTVGRFGDIQCSHHLLSFSRLHFHKSSLLCHLTKVRILLKYVSFNSALSTCILS